MPGDATRKTFKERQFEKAQGNAVGAGVSFGLCVLGTVMVTLGAVFAKDCKIHDLDVSTRDKPDSRGNLPTWMIGTGILYILSSWMFCWTIGCVPLMLRCFRASGPNALANCLGVLGYFVLFVFALISVCCHTFGCLWLYLASRVRNEDNSSQPDDPNYCHPAIWATMHFVVSLYGCVLALVLIYPFIWCYKKFQQ